MNNPRIDSRQHRPLPRLVPGHIGGHQRPQPRRVDVGHFRQVQDHRRNILPPNRVLKIRKIFRDQWPLEHKHSPAAPAVERPLHLQWFRLHLRIVTRPGTILPRPDARTHDEVILAAGGIPPSPRSCGIRSLRGTEHRNLWLQTTYRQNIPDKGLSVRSTLYLGTRPASYL